MASKRQKKKQWKQQGGTLRCTLCGKLLWSYRGDFVSGKSGVVCRQCLRTACYRTDFINAPPTMLKASLEPIFWSLAEPPKSSLDALERRLLQVQSP